MNIRKVKRKCSVRGCKNTDCFAISKVREVGNSVIICASCLKDGVEAVEGYIPEPKKKHKTAPPLFYNNVNRARVNTKIQPQGDEDDKETKVIGVSAFVCAVCGKEYKTESAYKKHLTSHSEAQDKEESE